MDRFLAQFKLLDLLGYLVPGGLLLLALVPCGAELYAGEWRPPEVPDGIEIPAWIGLSYVAGFLVSTFTERIACILELKLIPWSRHVRRLGARALTRHIKATRVFLPHKRGWGVIGSSGVYKNVGKTFDSLLLARLAMPGYPSPQRPDFDQIELIAIAEALVRGSAQGDELDRSMAMRRFSAGLVGVFIIIAAAYWACGERQIAMLVFCAFLMAVYVRSGDAVERVNDTISSGLAKLLESADTGRRPTEVSRS